MKLNYEMPGVNSSPIDIAYHQKCNYNRKYKSGPEPDSLSGQGSSRRLTINDKISADQQEYRLPAPAATCSHSFPCNLPG